MKQKHVLMKSNPFVELSEKSLYTYWFHTIHKSKVGFAFLVMRLLNRLETIRKKEKRKKECIV